MMHQLGTSLPLELSQERSLDEDPIVMSICQYCTLQIYIKTCKSISQRLLDDLCGLRVPTFQVGLSLSTPRVGFDESASRRCFLDSGAKMRVRLYD
jgi:hypothetical protein